MIRPERQAGFSLIEALVSMVLISVASGALIPSVNSASRNSAARFEALALALAAQDRLIEFQSGTLSDGAQGERIDDENVRWVYEIQSLDQDENRRGARLYRISLAIYMPAGTDNPRMKIETYAVGQ